MSMVLTTTGRLRLPFTDEPFMTRIRRETRAAHLRLEQHLGLPDSLRTIEDYRELLIGFYGIYRPLEGAIGRFAPVLPFDYAKRRKIHRLEADLSWLGLTGIEFKALPVCKHLPSIVSPATATGVQYVLEGATLGGQVLARQLSAKFNIAAGEGLSFFLGYGDQNGAMWAEFRQAITGFATDEERAATMIESARETFTAFYRWPGGESR
jgi:heme oxygenase (biliverdin-IX-beta and delta-forming)